jgi:hypothetical protein
LRGTLPEEDGKYDNFSWEARNAEYEAKPRPQPRPVPLARLKRDREEVKEIVDEKVGTWLDGIPVPEEIGEDIVDETVGTWLNGVPVPEEIGEETVEAPAEDNADEETAVEIRRRLKGKQKMHSIIDPP